MCYNKREFTLIYEKERGNGIMHILKKVIAAVAAAAFAASAITGCHDKNMPERTKKEFDKARALLSLAALP